jgi:phosphate starvation-inducible PhoH-like protein
MIISGDLEQSDRYLEDDVNKSGLYEAMSLLQDIDGIGMYEFDGSDIVRNPIITAILKRFNEYKAYK